MTAVVKRTKHVSRGPTVFEQEKRELSDFDHRKHMYETQFSLLSLLVSCVLPVMMTVETQPQILSSFPTLPLTTFGVLLFYTPFGSSGVGQQKLLHYYICFKAGVGL